MSKRNISFKNQIEKNKQTRTNNKYALVDSMVEYNKKGPATGSPKHIF